MDYFFGLFKSKKIQSEPQIQFGRYADTYKPEVKYASWSKSVELFDNEKYLYSFQYLLDFLQVDGNNNVKYLLEQGHLTFSLSQGSSIIQGEADHVRFKAEAKIAIMKKITHHDVIITIGSCFSQNIGELLQKYKFKCISNPFGTVFNPISIAKLIDHVIKNQMVDVSQAVYSQGRWVHPDFHSIYCSPDKNILTKMINDSISAVHDKLRISSHLFITLGTSIAYSQKNTGNVVSNCHRLPSDFFIKQNIDIALGTHALDDMISSLKKFNSDLAVTLTVSPVRHIKDGLIENTRSKAALHIMIQNLLKTNPEIMYFPAYEWVIDDLRDYRYYGQDLIHPNDQAIEYIWDKFRSIYMSDQTQKIIYLLDEIQKGRHHKPFNPDGEEYKKFCLTMIKKIEDLQKARPEIDMKDELKFFNNVR